MFSHSTFAFPCAALPPTSPLSQFLRPSRHCAQRGSFIEGIRHVLAPPSHGIAQGGSDDNFTICCQAALLFPAIFLRPLGMEICLPYFTCSRTPADSRSFGDADVLAPRLCGRRGPGREPPCRFCSSSGPSSCSCSCTSSSSSLCSDANQSQVVRRNVCIDRYHTRIFDPSLVPFDLDPSLIIQGAVDRLLL